MLDQYGGRASGAASGGAAVRSLAKARDHRACGRFDRAESTLRRVLGAEPNHPEAYYELGQIAARHAPEKAVTHFVTALRRALERPNYRLALGRGRQPAAVAGARPSRMKATSPSAASTA
ncbi:tetratricopeptide repeat protein [Methylobacterium brachiatum]|uniref:Tetratricopeptide repeat protein n=1 Tax=Methylobacterium brachiatum TaxID=269660 RepID=A0ABV1R8D1_9HYPH